MSDFDSELDTLIEYTQWVATRRAATQDTTPEEFMRDRIKQTAVDRISDAVQYYETVEQTPDAATMYQMLQGTYIAPEDTELEGEVVNDT
jgi:hypothetical protein